MARDSQAALVALNRFGFGARGGNNDVLGNLEGVLTTIQTELSG
ncbi:hypothetical protein [Bradyrhizobium sp.]